MYENWILDITHANDENFIPCFCPVIGDTIVFGLSMLRNRCPGNLTGVFHPDGEKGALEWLYKNPDWHEKYCSDKEKENEQVDA